MLGDDRFTIQPMGRGFVKIGAEKPDPEDVRLVEEAWRFASENMQGREYDLIILDEINYAISYKMLSPEIVVEALKAKPEMLHVILTGRNAHPLIVECADLVTEMREVKHPYQRGIQAQRGIEY
jgi:cob(I)alamin adenosyltransferase